MILIGSFLLTHIPCRRTSASLSPGAQGMGIKNKRGGGGAHTHTHTHTHTPHTPFPGNPRCASGGSGSGGGVDRCLTSATQQPRVRPGDTRHRRARASGARQREHSPDARGARRGSLQKHKQMRSVARSESGPAGAGGHGEKQGRCGPTSLLSLFLSFFPSSFQGWVVRLFASGST